MPKFEAKKGDFANIWQKLGALASQPPQLRRPCNCAGDARGLLIRGLPIRNNYAVLQKSIFAISTMFSLFSNLVPGLFIKDFVCTLLCHFPWFLKTVMIAVTVPDMSLALSQALWQI